MKIKITRSVLVTPMNGTPRAASVGEVVEVDKAQAQLLVGLRKAEMVGGKVETAAADPRTESADARPLARTRA
jgi:hypothetical protein